MKINKVVLENYKSYVNRTEFDLSGDKHLNIIFGDNGNGKTSFLEGISLALFGCKMFNSNNYTKEYISFVTSKLSNNSSSDTFCISLEFEENNALYYVERSYIIKDDSIVNEEVLFLKNGDLVEEIPLLNQYDYNCIKSFFLNGEVITGLIDNNIFEKFINNLIEISFDLKVFKQITNDIDKLRYENFKQYQTGEYEAIKKVVNALSKRINDIEIHYSRNIDDIKVNQNNLVMIEKKMNKKNIVSDIKLQQLIEENDIYTKQYKENMSEIKALLLEDVQLLLHKKPLLKIVSNLEDTRESRIQELISMYNDIDKNILSKDFIEFSDEKYLVDIKNKISNIKVDEVINLVENTKKIKRKLERNKNKIKNTKEGRDTLDISEEHKFNENNIKNLESENKALLKKQAELKNEYNSKIKILDVLEKKILKDKIDKQALKEEKKLIGVVNEYIYIKEKEIYKKIGNRTLSILQDSLLRKSDLVDRVVINKEGIYLYNKGMSIDYMNFSAGEKQMLILGVIFSIISEAKLNIPLVADTFVARLDSNHTNRILNYLKNDVNMQVIFLSTTKEIGKVEYDLLSSDLNKCYELINDGFNTIIEEYSGG